MRAAPPDEPSGREYLAFERASPTRHAFLAGEIFDMSGGSREHSLIGANFVGELRAALRGRPCEVHGPDLRIHIPRTGLYTYADALVVCGRVEFADDVRDTLLNPAAVVEVLSDSTEAYDRGEKFHHYRSVPSLSHYVLASQRQVLLEHFARQPDGSWAFVVLGPGERLVIGRPLGAPAEIAVDALYDRVFEAADGHDASR
ncbi:MAG: Uma2 family endonuclease [Deltaproteobacteria bacterium]|nr:Uma2 family endonuclease [Deltaproteobacteria bacterium]